MLFRSDSDRTDACLNVLRQGDYIGYMEGYLRGAHRLVQHVIDTQRDQDYLVYPIVFLYRHHIELVLKRIILRAPHLTDRELSEAETKHLGRHSLDELWSDLKQLLSAICESAGWEPLDSEDIEGVDSYIGQLVRLDPASYSFRYASSKKGDPSLPSELKVINLGHFAEMMERLASYLDAIDSATDHLEEMRAEIMEAEECWRNSDCA